MLATNTLGFQYKNSLALNNSSSCLELTDREMVCINGGSETNTNSINTIVTSDDDATVIVIDKVITIPPGSKSPIHPINTIVT